MKKNLIALLVLALALVAVVPAFAQDAAPLPTIAETVVAAAGGSPAEFSTLLTAVQAADPAVLEKLSDPEANLLVFAPTDAAFAALAESLGEEAFGAILADPAALTNILLYHVIEAPEGATDHAKLGDIAGGLASLGGSLGFVTLSGQSIDLASADGATVTVDGANVVTTDVEASNGVIQVIDAVLVPESRTIAEIVVDMAGDMEAPQFTSLLAAVQAADPAVLELLSDPEASLTVFAPTDEAFAAVGEEALNSVLADAAVVTSVLQYHVLPTNVHAYDLLSNMDSMMALMSEDGLLVDSALEGQQLAVKATATEDGMLALNVNGANVVIRDVDAANGVIHVIDAVLLPPQ